MTPCVQVYVHQCTVGNRFGCPHPGCVLPIVPVSRNLEENVGALAVKLTPEEVQELSEAVAPEKVRTGSWRHAARQHTRVYMI